MPPAGAGGRGFRADWKPGPPPELHSLLFMLPSLRTRKITCSSVWDSCSRSERRGRNHFHELLWSGLSRVWGSSPAQVLLAPISHRGAGPPGVKGLSPPSTLSRDGRWPPGPQPSSPHATWPPAETRCARAAGGGGGWHTSREGWGATRSCGRSACPEGRAFAPPPSCPPSGTTDCGGKEGAGTPSAPVPPLANREVGRGDVPGPGPRKGWQSLEGVRPP